MYGYSSPKRPELGLVRVMVCESEIRALQKKYPALSYAQVLTVMIQAGPQRQSVEAALAALSAHPRSS